MDALSSLPVPLQQVLPATRQGHAGDARSLEGVARNFESTLLSLLLKEMRQSLEPGGLFAEDKADVQGGLFDFYLGEHLAKAGGLGMARMLKRQLENAASHDPPGSTPAPKP